MEEPRSIVPLLTPEEIAGIAAPLAPAAKVTHHGGPVLTAVEVVTIFWGAAWGQSPQTTLAQDLNTFFDWILQSSLMDAMAEYSTAGNTIGHGSRIGTATVTASEPGTAQPGGGRIVSDAEIQTAIQGWITDGTVAATTANTLYFIYLPQTSYRRAAATSPVPSTAGITATSAAPSFTPLSPTSPVLGAASARSSTLKPR
jgi:hypothetical protein